MTHIPYRWLLVASGGLIGCVAMGTFFSLPVLLLAIVRDTGWSSASVSVAMTLGFLALAVGSLTWGALTDRYGPRVVVVLGSLIIPSCAALAAHAHAVLTFQLLFGIGVGLGTAAIFAPLMATVTGWFDTHRSLAVSLVSAGIGLAPMTLSPLAAKLLATTHDWRYTLQLLAALAITLMLPLSLTVRRPPMPDTAGQQINQPMQTARTGEVLRSPLFIILLLTNFFCCATHSGPIIHTISYALTCGLPLTAAVSIYSMEGLAGLGGRLVFGLAGDRFGAKRVLVAGLLAQAIGTLGYLAATSLWGFYAAGATFGFIYAGVMPLYAVLARENFPMRMMGTVIGGTTMAGSLGMATGPIAGGLIFQTTGTYRGLYLSAFVLGLTATLIALLFRPAPPPPSHPAPTMA
ncbi:MAG: MFS transporter [Proteobacteria bacterium]|nr:MFS transporter [Pseudomonadota bacterium]